MTAYPSCGRVLRVFRACFARQEAPWWHVLRVFRVLRVEIEQKQEARGGAARNTKTFYRAFVARAKDAKHAQDGVNADPESGRTTAKDAERRTPEKDAAGVVCREVIG